MAVRTAKTQIRPVWSESSLSAWRNLGPLTTHWAHSEDSDQTGLMPRLIWVFAISLSWCPGWSESSLGVQAFCWFCHVAAHVVCANSIRGLWCAGSPEPFLFAYLITVFLFSILGMGAGSFAFGKTARNHGKLGKSATCINAVLWSCAHMDK